MVGFIGSYRQRSAVEQPVTPHTTFVRVPAEPGHSSSVAGKTRHEVSWVGLADHGVDADAITANEVPPAHAGDTEIELLEVQIGRRVPRERGLFPGVIWIAVIRRILAAASRDEGHDCKPRPEGGVSGGTHMENYEPTTA